MDARDAIKSTTSKLRQFNKVNLHLFNIVGVHVEENDVQSHVDDELMEEEKEVGPLPDISHQHNQLIGR